MTDRELLQQALDSLEWAERRYSHANLDLFNKPIEAIRTRLAQPEPEQEWKGLSDKAKIHLIKQSAKLTTIELIEVVEDELRFNQFGNFINNGFLNSKINPIKKEWVNLTPEEHIAIGKKINYDPLVMTAHEFRIAAQIQTELLLKEKNGMD